MLRQVAPELWVGETELTMPGGVHFPCRMTLIRLPDGGIWLHSPIRYSDNLAEEIEKLGKIRWLVAPNLYHHLFVGGWARRFPEARLIAAPGLARKRKNLDITQELDKEPPLEWRETLDQQFLNGAGGISETVFYHRPTRTLIVTDLIFNITRPRGLMTKLLLTLSGTRGKVANSRLWRFFIKDKTALRHDLQKVMSWNIERVVAAHGDILEKDARTTLEAALTRVLGKK